MRTFAVGVVVAAAFGAGVATAQAPFPSPALKAAPSLQAAYAAIGAVAATPSTHLLLDIPEIAAAGVVKAKAASFIPGTTQLYLLRTIPTVAKLPSGAQKKVSVAKASGGAARAPAAGARAPAQAPVPDLPSVLIDARQVGAGEPASFSTEFTFESREFFTLLAFAQGKWFVTGREIKPAKMLSPGP